jgi:ATP/ADP translocase
MTPMSADAVVSDATNRTARGGVQNTAAGAVVTLIVYFAFERSGDSLPAAVVAAMIVVVAGVLTFGQNIYENRTGRAFLKNVPAEPEASVEVPDDEPAEEPPARVHRTRRAPRGE